LTKTSDHVSQLLFLERVTGVREPNISDWRRETVSDLTGAFRFGNASEEAPLPPDTTGQFNLAQFEASQLPLPSIPGSKQTTPTQERGHRKRVG
jgi:phospholipase C